MLKRLLARRNVHKLEERNLRARVENRRLFRLFIAQAFYRDTVLLRCEAFAAFIDENDGGGGDWIRYETDILRRSPKAPRWRRLEQYAGSALNGTLSGDRWTRDFDPFWKRWRDRRLGTSARNAEGCVD